MIEWLLVVLAVPFGLWLRKAAKDELEMGKPWFKGLVVIGILAMVGFIFAKETAAAITCLAIAIIAGISLKK